MTYDDNGWTNDTNFLSTYFSCIFRLEAHFFIPYSLSLVALILKHILKSFSRIQMQKITGIMIKIS